MKKWDIFAKLQEEITDFDTGGYYLVGEPNTDSKRKSKGEKGGYYYSQKDTTDAIALAEASKFKEGIKDREGQRKTYVNIVCFYRDVMKMKIAIRTANYIFEPEELDYLWPTYLMSKKFTNWAEDESYDDEIADYANDLATYGSTVTKKLKKCTSRVPLRTLRNTQSAKSLWHAASTGGYAIIEDDFHYNEMKEFPDWNLKGLSKSKSYNTFERYGLVPKKLYDNWKENDGVLESFDEQNDEMILVQAILVPEEKGATNKMNTGRVVWMEKLDEESWPLEEAHVERRDGRWLGVGDIEKQLENQISRNLTANLRRRGLLWAVKKIYQSTDDEVQNQLLMEVADGQVLYVKKDGQITQVNTSNQHLGEFNADEEMWKENSQQRSFAFNIATGENMPSGTSFSLGVVLEKAVSSHFTDVRHRFSNFLKRCFFNQITDIFQDEYSGAHTQQFKMSASDIEGLKEQVITFYANERYWENITKREFKTLDIIREEVAKEMERNPYLFVDIPEDYYPRAGYYMKLNIDDDIGPDIATLTTVWQAYNAKGDPRADHVLKMILAKRGRNLDQMLGGKQPEQPQPGAMPAIPENMPTVAPVVTK